MKEIGQHRQDERLGVHQLFHLEALPVRVRRTVPVRVENRAMWTVEREGMDGLAQAGGLQECSETGERPLGGGSGGQRGQRSPDAVLHPWRDLNAFMAQQVPAPNPRPMPIAGVIDIAKPAGSKARCLRPTRSARRHGERGDLSAASLIEQEDLRVGVTAELKS